MKYFPTDRPWSWLAVLAMVGASGQGWGQQDRFRRVEEPRWLRLDIREVSSGVYAEGRYEETTYDNSGTSVRRDYLFVGPSLGLGMSGSVYHPNLMRFSLDNEGAVGWGQEHLSSSTSDRNRDEFRYLGRFNGNAHILSTKPYASRVYANYDHTYRDYDFFNRVTVDALRYGARSGYSEGPVPVSVDYFHRDEDVKGNYGTTTWIEDVLSASARNQRQRGYSYFNYIIDQYKRTDYGLSREGTNHRVSGANTERFGALEQYQLLTSGSYYQDDYLVEKTKQYIANGNFSAEHRDNLSSVYDFTYDRYETGDFQSDNYVGWGELRHQLYDSLTSRLIGQGADYSVSDSESSGYTRRYGGGVSERYTKQVSASTRLQVENSVLVEHVDQESIATIRDERHSFSDALGGAPPDSFFLNAPKVNQGSIVVTDVNNTQPPYFLGLDYTIEVIGDRTLIQRPTGSRIPRDATVLVDYEVEPTPPGDYESLSEVFQVRLDLWNRFWGIYGRINLNRNNAPSEMRVFDLSSYTAGTDVTWRWLRAGAEYEYYDSTQSAYWATRFFQSFSFRPDQASSLGLNFTETYTEFIDSDRTQENYRFISNYHRNFTSHFYFDFDGGVALRRGRGVDQTLATARPSIKYTRGQTTISAGYDFEYQLYLDNEERYKHFFMLRAKRVF